MHMRRKKWARPELAACPYFLDAPTALRGHWREVFAKDQPLELELGCGKGVGTAEMVRATPEVNFVAIDITCDILGDARRNIARAFGEEEPQNVRIVRHDIEYISTIFAPEDVVRRIHIAFCNPWTRRPKYEKRRLTHPRQLLQYRAFMQPGGEIWFKTDDDALFEDSLAYFDVCGFETAFLTRDLYASGFQPNFLTEHEKKFTAQGIPTKMGIFRKTDKAIDLDPVRWHLPKRPGQAQAREAEDV